MTPASHSAREAGRIQALQCLGIPTEKTAGLPGLGFRALASVGKAGGRAVGKALWHGGGYLLSGGHVGKAIEKGLGYAGRGAQAAMRRFNVPANVRAGLGNVARDIPRDAAMFGGFSGLLGGASGYMDKGKWDWGRAGKGLLTGAIGGAAWGGTTGLTRNAFKGVAGKVAPGSWGAMREASKASGATWRQKAPYFALATGVPMGVALTSDLVGPGAALHHAMGGPMGAPQQQPHQQYAHPQLQLPQPRNPYYNYNYRYRYR